VQLSRDHIVFFFEIALLALVPVPQFRKENFFFLGQLVFCSAGHGQATRHRDGTLQAVVGTSLPFFCILVFFKYFPPPGQWIKGLRPDGLKFRLFSLSGLD